MINSAVHTNLSDGTAHPERCRCHIRLCSPSPEQGGASLRAAFKAQRLPGEPASLGAILAPGWKSTWFNIPYCGNWGAAGTETLSVAAETQGVSVSLGEFMQGVGFRAVMQEKNQTHRPDLCPLEASLLSSLSLLQGSDS